MNYQLNKIDKDFWSNDIYCDDWYAFFYLKYERCCGCLPNNLLSNRIFYKL